jgi:hypothetical protein
MAGGISRAHGLQMARIHHPQKWAHGIWKYLQMKGVLKKVWYKPMWDKK